MTTSEKVAYLKGLVEGLVGHVEDATQCEHIAALIGSLLISALLLADTSGEGGYGSLDDGVLAFQLIGEGIVGIAGLLHCLIGKGVDVDNNRSAFLSPLQVGLERGGVHGNEDVALVARAIDMVSNMYLVARNARDSVVRSTDLGGIVGESGDVVTRQG